MPNDLKSDDPQIIPNALKKKRFGWQWPVVGAVVLGVVAMEGIPTMRFAMDQTAKQEAVQRVYACRLNKGLKTADRSLIRWEMDQSGPKKWRETAEKLEKSCKG